MLPLITITDLAVAATVKTALEAQLAVERNLYQDSASSWAQSLAYGVRPSDAEVFTSTAANISYFEMLIGEVEREIVSLRLSIIESV